MGSGPTLAAPLPSAATAAAWQVIRTWATGDAGCLLGTPHGGRPEICRPGTPASGLSAVMITCLLVRGLWVS